ncbi:ABC transporter ATP-binding protein [Arthrobacter sp. NPDC089319]|uniref:ABC transporter ATP-binding protein n=1 Tax=Arthrobacter sp. NPDC089319 TaxID=3155915 RepID=UPI0034123794
MEAVRPKTGPNVAISLRGIGQDFGEVTVLDDVNLDIAHGSATALVGPNGAGKSTAMNVMAGSQIPTRGTVLHEGKDITKARPYVRARRGILRTFQLPSDFGRMTVLENLLVGASQIIGRERLYGFLDWPGSWSAKEAESVKRARALLSDFGLSAKESDYAQDLSGGQRRIVELLRAMMAEPRVLLLDEPFAGLHPSIISTVGDFVRDVREQGVTVVMIAHELDAVEDICDHVVVMARGTVLFEGSMAEARRDQKVVEAYVAG